jgi:hypothetical protein
MRDRIIASSILGAAILVASIILSLSIVYLGDKILHASSGMSNPVVNLQNAGGRPVVIREEK